MRFKKRRGIHLSYNRQGLIYFTCMDAKNQPEEVQRKILNLCMKAGGVYYRALYDVVTSEDSIRRIAIRHHVSETLLYKLRKTFYENW